MKKKSELCPLCEEKYHRKNPATRHHIYPRSWYVCDVVVDVCHACHHWFNEMNPMTSIWSIPSCLSKWVKFCLLFKKNAFEIYPNLKHVNKHTIYVK